MILKPQLLFIKLIRVVRHLEPQSRARLVVTWVGCAVFSPFVVRLCAWVRERPHDEGYPAQHSDWEVRGRTRPYLLEGDYQVE